MNYRHDEAPSSRGHGAAFLADNSLEVLAFLPPATLLSRHRATVAESPFRYPCITPEGTHDFSKCDRQAGAQGAQAGEVHRYRRPQLEARGGAFRGPR